MLAGTPRDKLRIQSGRCPDSNETPDLLPYAHAAKLSVIRPEAYITTGILIVDDHRIFCEALTELIEKKSDMRVVGCADNARDALQFLIGARHQVEIVLVDITLKGRSGLDLLKDMKAHGVRVPALVLSMH